MGRIVAICTSDKKGVRKSPVSTALFVAGYGIDGDAHAGLWHRQVSLLATEDIQQVREGGLPDITDGDFAENLVLSGINTDSLGVGSRIRLGATVELELTQIGKECHKPCRIHYLTGACIMPTRGLFARVEVGGHLAIGDSAKVLQCVPRPSVTDYLPATNSHV